MTDVAEMFYQTPHLYLSLPRYGVLKHEMRAFCNILIDIITVGWEEEVLVVIIRERRGRCGGHRLVAGIPAPVATSWTAVASRQHLFPSPVGWLWNCIWKNTQRGCVIFDIFEPTIFSWTRYYKLSQILPHKLFYGLLTSLVILNLQDFIITQHKHRPMLNIGCVKDTFITTKN